MDLSTHEIAWYLYLGIPGLALVTVILFVSTHLKN